MVANNHLLIGIDVGGTNTDSVLINPFQVTSESRGVLAWNKSTTTADVSEGIEDAIKSLLDQSSTVKKTDVMAVTIGTTHFINAVIEQDKGRLERVAVLRLCGPYTRNCPPFSDFPDGLKEITNGYIGYLNGGNHIDRNEIKKIDEKEVLEHCEKIKELGIKAICIVGVFSPLSSVHENEVASIVQREIVDAHVVQSHSVSGIGFLERENAAILNASIMSFAIKVINSFQSAITRIGLNCPVLLTQNDGTILSANKAKQTPISTFSSGATNSMRGAAFLCSGDESIQGNSIMVVDVGGTTTDVGLLLPTGFPRLYSSYSTVGGVRMNFSMPHVESIGLGGGSIVRIGKESMTVGPDSVGADIKEKAILFGGDITTASDVTVAIGTEEVIGDSSLVNGRFTISELRSYNDLVKKKLETVIDRMRTSPDPLPVLLVGGGSFIVPNVLDGASKVIRPPFHSVANAIGAAMGKVSATINRIETVRPGIDSQEQFLEDMKKEAYATAVNNGALLESITIVELSHEPIPYVDNTVQFFVKVIGDLNYGELADIFQKQEEDLKLEKSSDFPYNNRVTKDSNVKIDTSTKAEVNFLDYKPTITDNREWILSETDLEFLQIGVYILGCGGGGNPYSSFLETRNYIRNGDTIRVVDVDDLRKHIKGKGSIIPIGFGGSPTVAHERLKGEEFATAFQFLSKYMNLKPDMVFPLEIGGMNGFTAFELGASSKLNLPVVDCDLMGRAYPTWWQTVPVVYSDEAFYPPTAISNGNGNTLIIAEASSDLLLEKVLRASLSELGAFVGVVNTPMTIEEMQNKSVHRSISLAWRIGKAVKIARSRSEIEILPQRIIESIGGYASGKLLFEGKIISVERTLMKGHVYGSVVIGAISGTNKMTIPFKNENILCWTHDDDSSEKTVVATVPDLISVVDSNNGEAVGTPDYRYGLLVFVLGISPSNKWTDTEKGIEIGGPAAFGFDDVTYEPLGKYTRPESVIQEYS